MDFTASGKAATPLRSHWFKQARQWHERGRRRAAADRWLASANRRVEPRYGWRVVELTSKRERTQLARSVRKLARDVSADRLPGPVPLNRTAVRAQTTRLVRLAERLEAFDHPVAARGIIHLRWLLTDPRSPLYAPPQNDGAPSGDEYRSSAIGLALTAVLVELEPA
jgi:hypothetical protein